MNPPPVELRKWFQVLTGVLSLAIVLTCFKTLGAVIPPQLDAQFSLVVLFLGSTLGINRLLTSFLAIVITKLWPQLEQPRA